MKASDPTRFAYKLRRGLERPDRIIPYFRRLVRNRRIGLGAQNHISFYRRVVADMASKNPDAAVGSRTREEWLEIGSRQFSYLCDHGLEPEHRLLEIGCGNLRAGWRFISYLRPGNYVGIDISPEILSMAQATLVEFELQSKLPYLFPIDEMSFDLFPTGHFDVVHAHSVFTHATAATIEACFAGVGRVMKLDAFFDFTFNPTDGGQRNFLGENFYYPRSFFLELAQRYDFTAKEMSDWDYPQAKMRLTRA